MTIIEKSFFDGDTHTVKFICGASYTIGSFFELVDASPIEYGDFDRNELSFFPSMVRFTITDYQINNMFALKNAMSAYSRSFPYNFKGIFYTEYFINGVLKHTGVISEVNYTDEDDQIVITVTDACEYFKNSQMDTALFLEYMSQNGLPRKTVNVAGSYNVYFYGLDNAVIRRLPGFDKYQIFVNDVTDWSMPLMNFLNIIFKAVNPDVNFTADVDLLYADNPEFSGAVTMTSLIMSGVFDNYLGRYAVVPVNTDPGLVVDEDIFELIEETQSFKVYVYKETPGIDDKNLISVVENICYNFFARIGFISFDNIVLTKKFSNDPDVCTEITDDDIIDPEYRRDSFIPNVVCVRVNDRFSGRSATRGIYSSRLTDDEKLEYSINLSAYRDGSLSGYSLYYKVGSVVKAAYYCKDPVSGYSGSIPEVLAQLEWWHRKEFRDKITLLLWGIGWIFSQTYKMRDKGHSMRLLRPMRMKLDSEKNETYAEFIDITKS